HATVEAVRNDLDTGRRSMDRGPAGGPPERHLASSVSIILASGEGWWGGMVSDLEGWWRDGVRLWRDGVRLCSWFLLGGMVEGWCQTLEGWCQTLFLVLTQQFPACDFRPENTLVLISHFANSLRIM